MSYYEERAKLETQLMVIRQERKATEIARCEMHARHETENLGGKRLALEAEARILDVKAELTRLHLEHDRERQDWIHRAHLLLSSLRARGVDLGGEGLALLGEMEERRGPLCHR